MEAIPVTKCKRYLCGRETQTHMGMGDGPEADSETTWPHGLNSKGCSGPSSNSSKGLKEGANRSSRGGR